jgi:hypothetical protein
MGFLFYNCKSLVSVDMSVLDVSNIQFMQWMLYGCTLLETVTTTGWDTSSVLNLDAMLRSCPALINVTPNEWDISNCSNFFSFLTGSSIPTSVYDATLIAWDALTVKSNEAVNFGNSTYTGGGVAAAAKLSLETADNWTITDGGIA